MHKKCTWTRNFHSYNGNKHGGVGQTNGQPARVLLSGRAHAPPVGMQRTGDKPASIARITLPAC